jgi:hypothetical protein
MDYWSWYCSVNIPDLERKAEEAMERVDRAMKGVVEARGRLSHAQICAAERVVLLDRARERVAQDEAHAANQLPPAPAMNSWDNRHVRPGRFSVVGPAPIVEVEPLSGSFPRRPRPVTLVAAPVQRQREGVIHIPDRAPAPLRADPPIRRCTPAVAVAPLHSPSRREVLPRRAPANVAIRKTLTDPCYICYEAFECLDDATFCRTKCPSGMF